MVRFGPVSQRELFLSLVGFGLIAAAWAALPGAWAYVPGGLFALLSPWLPDPRTPGDFERAWRVRLDRRPEIELRRMQAMARIDILVSLGTAVSVFGLVAWGVASNGGSVMSVYLSALGFAALGRAVRTGFGARAIDQDRRLPMRSGIGSW